HSHKKCEVGRRDWIRVKLLVHEVRKHNPWTPIGPPFHIFRREAREGYCGSQSKLSDCQKRGSRDCQHLPAPRLQLDLVEPRQAVLSERNVTPSLACFRDLNVFQWDKALADAGGRSRRWTEHQIVSTL